MTRRRPSSSSSRTKRVATSSGDQSCTMTDSEGIRHARVRIESGSLPPPLPRWYERRVTRRLGGPLVIGSVLFLATSRHAAAQSMPPALTWDAPAVCPTAEDVQARIATRVDGPPRDVRVRVSEVPDGVRVEMSTGGADRTFVAPTCDDAATAVAVIVALAARAEARAPPPTTAARPAFPVAPPGDPARDRPVVSPPPIAGPVTRWSAAVGAAIDTSSPHLSPGFTVGAQARRGLGAVGVSGSAFLPQTEHAMSVPPVQTTVTLVDLLALGCLLVPVATQLDAGGCLGAGVGILHGQSGSIDRPRSNIGARFESVLLARVELAVTSAIVLRLEGGGLADPVRSPFRVEGLGDVYRPPAFALRLGAWVDLRFR